MAGALGAEIHGVNLKTLQDDSGWQEIHRAFVEHSVIVFRDQDLAPAEILPVAAIWRLIVGAEHVVAPKLHGIEPQCFGHHVRVAFDGEKGLHLSRRAEITGGNLIGVGRVTFHENVGSSIGAGQQIGAVESVAGIARGIGAAVVIDLPVPGAQGQLGRRLTPRLRRWPTPDGLALPTHTRHGAAGCFATPPPV